MPKIVLGVIDIPYQNDRKEITKALRSLHGNARAKTKSSSAPQQKSTGDVATILEEKYHVMEIFVALHEKDIAGYLEETLGDNLADLLSGGRGIGGNSMLAATSQIETLFQKFIDTKEMDGVQPGVPTAAALAGVNHRLKHPFSASNPERPSFKDRGLYEASFHAEFQE